MKDNQHHKGKTITFYSYKGGVGRTMTLVNIACLMSMEKKNVLLIDWDLEAPGLHSFFKDKIPSSNMGLVDLIFDFKDYLSQNEDKNEDEYYLKFLKKNVNKYITKVSFKDINNNLGSLSIIKAGKFDNQYSSKLSKIDWPVFYENSPSFFRIFAEYLEEIYDYIIIDSRTGLADISGICTMLMPQILVLVFALNEQNLNGVLDVAKQSYNYRCDSYDTRRLTILPLPSRIDNENPTDLAYWINNYTERFEFLFKEFYSIRECRLKNYFDIAKIPYKPNYAYGENIPVLIENKRTNNDFFISFHYEKFFKLIEEISPIWLILNDKQIQENKKKSELHFKKGKEDILEKNYKTACLELEKANSLDFSSEEILISWGNALCSFGEELGNTELFNNGIDKYDRAIELNPQNDIAYYCWGNSLFNLGKLKKDEFLYMQGFDLISKSLEINPDNKSAKLMLQRIENVPIEIKKNGIAAVINYIKSIEEGNSRINEARIIILGDNGAGKTCLARRLKNPNTKMTTDEESTSGVDTSEWKLEKENVNVHIWDFAGHTVIHALHQFFLSERCLYIIVYDGRTEGRNRLEYWLDHMKNYGKDSKALILVNKRDAHAVEIPVNKLKEQYPIIDVCTFSIRDDHEKLESFRQKVVEYIATNPSWNKLQIPANSYNVKNELEKLFNNRIENGKEWIERHEFETIAEKCHVEKVNMDSLLSDLHDLGIIFWYKDIPGYNTLVLNPEWISNGVYRIINWANNQGKHCLKLTEFVLVFESDLARYPKSQHRFLFELMKKYELAYEAREKDVLIIPSLLHEDQPAKMPHFQVGESLMARYKADQPLMPDSISRFIVKHNEEIKKEAKKYLVWRNGVILEKIKGTIAMVRATDDRTITVSVKGSKRTEYLSSIRDTLNGIFEGYKSKKPELQYSVERVGEKEETIQKQMPLWLSDNKILTHAQYGIPYFDEYSSKQITLDTTVKVYNITAQTLIAGTDNQYLDQSTHNTFNFKDCNINLQGSLNDLARQLTKSGKTEEAKELKEAAELLVEAEECTKPAELKKKGIAAGLQRFAEKLSDEDSSLCKTIKGIEKGIDIAQDIAKGYNNIAQWAGLPQVPNVFLKKE